MKVNIDRAEKHERIDGVVRRARIDNIKAVLRGGKVHKHPSGGIVDRYQQATGGATIFDPLMKAAVKLHERSDGIPPSALLAMPTCCTRPKPLTT